MIKTAYWSSCKVQDILVQIEWNMCFLKTFSKNIQTSNLMKIRLVTAELFHADGRTNRQAGRNYYVIVVSHIFQTRLKISKKKKTVDIKT